MIVYFFQKGPIKPSCVSALLASLHAVYIWCLLFHSPLFCSLQAFLHAVFQGSIQLFICFCLGVGVCLFLSPLPVEGVGGDLSQLGCSPETEKTQKFSQRKRSRSQDCLVVQFLFLSDRERLKNWHFVTWESSSQKHRAILSSDNLSLFFTLVNSFTTHFDFTLWVILWCKEPLCTCIDHANEAKEQSKYADV